jgi:predicted metal-dependent hydrolase
MSVRTKVDIIRRRVKIPFETARAPGWIPSRQDIETILNAVSFVFPAGEKFFIQSVQHYQHRITDPVLKEQVKAFIFQEAMHSKEHARANAKLAESFPQGPEIDKGVALAMARLTRYAPHSTQLAITCALEHFTAILSHDLLHWQEGFIAKSDPAFAAMWLWHAVEEAEHKAVCFDVYQTVCGKGVFSYLHRTAAMLLATLMFAFVAFISVRMLRKGAKEPVADKTADPVAGQTDAPSGQRGPSGALQVLRETVPLRLYFDYFRPSFHPWDSDDSDVIAEWKRRYKDFPAISDLAHAAPAEAKA